VDPVLDAADPPPDRLFQVYKALQAVPQGAKVQVLDVLLQGLKNGVEFFQIF